MDILVTIGSILLSLTVTFLFNYFIGLPKKWKQTRKEERNAFNELVCRCDKQETQIAEMKAVIDSLPKYRQQSKDIQEELRNSDQEIVNLCREIANDVIQNRNEVMGKLTRLEDRERNTLRAKIIEEYRLYTNEIKNPMKAWTEMEHDAFFNLVEDYRDLGGNGYVEHTIMPEMDRLDIVRMDHLEQIKELYDSRRI